MSRSYEIYATLTLEQKVCESDRLFWKKVLFGAVDDPETLMERGIESIEDKAVEDDDDFDVFDYSDGETQILYQTERCIGGCYGLDGFLADLEKAVYLATKKMNKPFRLYVSGTDMDREPDETVETTFEDMEKKYSQCA